jgi:hypothetical protein
MITARTTTQAAEQPERDLVGKLLLTGMPHTDARPWIAGVGMAAVYVLFVLLEQLP